MDVELITPHTGAIIKGIDITQPLSTVDMDALYNLLHARHVIAIRDQNLDPESFKNFMQKFGELLQHPSSGHKIPDHPEVIRFNVSPGDTAARGMEWHSDVSCEECPPAYTGLWIDKMPDVGGDTLFINMHLVLAAFSKESQELFGKLWCIHDNTVAHKLTKNHVPREARHPLTITHPINGRPALYFNESFSRRIDGVPPIEDRFLRQMMHYMILSRDNLKCRVQWEPKTLVIWDNRSVLHKAIWDYKGQHRQGLRILCKEWQPAR